MIKTITPIRRHTLIAAALVSAVFSTARVSQAGDPLPSWNDGPAKQSIIDFVAKVTKPGSPDFVPVPERIATFDNDGTLWCEQPVPVQLYFALDRMKVLAPQHPEWKDEGTVRLAAQGRFENRARRRQPRIAGTFDGHARGHDHGGIRAGRQGLDRDRETSEDTTSGTPRWSISRCSRCSPTCARTASRPSSSPAAASSSCARGRSRFMASRRSRSIGSSIKTEVRNARRQARSCAFAGAGLH